MTIIDVRLIRQRLRISQEELGKMIGVSRNTIANYEKGGVIPESKRGLLLKLMNRDAAIEKILGVIQTSGDNHIAGNNNTFDTEIKTLKQRINELEDENRKLMASFKSTSNMKDEFEKLFSDKEINRLEKENEMLRSENKRLIEDIGYYKGLLDKDDIAYKKTE